MFQLVPPPVPFHTSQPQMTDEQKVILMQLLEHLDMNSFIKHIGKILQIKWNFDQILAA